MKNSSIEWCDHTFNPWIGCEPVSEGCRNCYAAALNNRFKNGTAELRGGRAVFNGTVRRTSASYWKQPLAWNRQHVCDSCGEFSNIMAIAGNLGKCPKCHADAMRQPRVFCASMADWLHEAVPDEWLADLLDLIRQTPNLDWLLLTKRPENFERRLVAAMESVVGNLDLESWIYAWIGQRKNPVLVEREPKAPRNVWIGTTVEDQAAADARIPALLKIPAAVRFLSCEPLLGAVDISTSLPDSVRMDGRRNSDWSGDRFVDWVIAGGESGAKARPMHPDWARGLRDQCVAAGVPFFFKQWGEFVQCRRTETTVSVDLCKEHHRRCPRNPEIVTLDDVEMMRVGKKAAGRLLDGREWNEFPPANDREGRE